MRMLLHIPNATWESEIALRIWVEQCVADATKTHPGHAVADLQVDPGSERVWLILTPLEDYAMDEGL